MKDKKTFLRAINPVLIFTDEECRIGRDLSVGKDELYTCYKTYCEEAGLRALSNTKFYRQILADHRSVKEIRPDGGIRTFDGIGLI